MIKLYDHQLEAVNKLKPGSILKGGVGSGKSLTALYYFMHKYKGKFLYIITTAMKRDSLDWEKEILLINPKARKIKYKIDSWNNIKKYKKEKGFFIFDEHRAIGDGVWSNTFIQIAKNNPWILLSATPGDVWKDYIPVFIAHGFYKNREEFENNHCMFNRFTPYKQILKYVDTETLYKYRNEVVVLMPFERHTISHKVYLEAVYDSALYKQTMKTLYNPYTKDYIYNAAELCYTIRKICNIDKDRLFKLENILKEHKKVIVFYNYNYELDNIIGHFKNTIIGQWNGHKHELVPDSDSWLYIVQYTAGAEGWNCIDTDTIVFYSLNYSYKIMAQAKGRIDRLNTPFIDLYYYYITSKSDIDKKIKTSIKNKKKFQENTYYKFTSRE